MDRQQLTFRTARVAEEAVLTAAGEIDMNTAESLYRAAVGLVDEGIALLVLDLGDVTFCDSLGVSALVRIYRHAVGTGCRLRVVNLRGHIAHVLQISGLDQMFEVQAS
jgi:anti-sigma B factor antagonist